MRLEASTYREIPNDPQWQIGIMPISDDKLYIFGTILEPEKRWYPPTEWTAYV
jgi:hypothetical protein